MEKDERHLPLHREPQAHVVPMPRVSAAIAVAHQPLVLDYIVVRSGLSFDNRHRGDAQWHLGEQGRLEYPLWSEERHPLAVEHESFREDLPWQHIAPEPRLLLEEPEGCHADAVVDSSTRRHGRWCSSPKDFLIVPPQKFRIGVVKGH